MTSTANAALYFALSTAFAFVAVGLILSIRRGRPHALLLLSFSAFTFSWLEAPYDWAIYAQFPPDMPRMPSWWPLNWTYGGGVPNSVPIGYMSYFSIPALVAVGVSHLICSAFGNLRRPLVLLNTGLVIGFAYTLVFNGIIGAKLGVFRYGRVIEGLAIRPGTVEQYPLYDAWAVGIQIMVFTYILGRLDVSGRTIIDAWADTKTSTRLRSSLLSLVTVAVIGNLMYISVFLPHYVTKVMHMATVAPSEQLYPGIPNQPI